LPGLVFGGEGDAWEAWMQAGGRLQFGALADPSSQAYVSWGPQNGVLAPAGGGVALPGGAAWLGPRLGVDSVAGIAWIWYREADARMGLAAELDYHWLSPWTSSSGAVGLPAPYYLVATPEFQARYGRYSAIVGWQASYLWAVEEPGTKYGDIIFDVAYTF
jgi:hypothetical protein